jgi:hypothetical protein
LVHQSPKAHVKRAKKEAEKQAANDANDYVSNQPKAAAFQNLTRKETTDASNNTGNHDTHNVDSAENNKTFHLQLLQKGNEERVALFQLARATKFVVRLIFSRSDVGAKRFLFFNQRLSRIVAI